MTIFARVARKAVEALMIGFLSPIIVDQPIAVLWCSRLVVTLYISNLIAGTPGWSHHAIGVYELAILIAQEPVLRALKTKIGIIGQDLASAFANRGDAEDPPRLAEFFVGLLAKARYRASLLQCLEEDFRNDLAAGISLRRAKRRYWAAALNSIGPQLWAAIKRVGVIGIVADYVRGKLGGA